METLESLKETALKRIESALQDLKTIDLNETFADVERFNVAAVALADATNEIIIINNSIEKGI